MSLQVEIVALRHQLALYHESVRRPRIRPGDRVLWTWPPRHWDRPWELLVFVQLATVVAWQRRRFRGHWTRLSQRQPGRPAVSQEVRRLVRAISIANPRWGAPQILEELRQLGITVAKATVEKYRVRPRRPPSPSWRTLLKTCMWEIVSLDFFPVPTAGFKMLFLLIILAHDRRRILHFNSYRASDRPVDRAAVGGGLPSDCCA